MCIGMQERDQSWQRDFTLWPFGVCHQVVQKNKPFDPAKWAEKTQHFADNWSHPHDGFPETSWEKIANDEMWNSHISAAFFMYQQGVSVDNHQAQVPLMVKCYEIYKQVLKKHKGREYPSFWHKNFALVAEKLIHLNGHQYSQQDACRQSIDHFEMYLKLESGDSDRTQIEAAIETLKGRLQMMQQLDQVAETTENIINRAMP